MLRVLQSIDYYSYNTAQNLHDAYRQSIMRKGARTVRVLLYEYETTRVASSMREDNMRRIKTGYGIFLLPMNKEPHRRGACSAAYTIRESDIAPCGGNMQGYSQWGSKIIRRGPGDPV